VLGADRLLRPQPARPTVAGDAAAHEQNPLTHLVAYVIICGFFYGAIMGTYPGHHGPRPLQMLYSGLKVPLLQGVSFALVLPGFFVVNTLLGLRNDFKPALRALISAQAVMSIVLAALAPLVPVWYASGVNYPAATCFNGVMFAVAVGAAQWPLRRLYGPLISRNPRHKIMLTGWLVLYIFVAIQMAWVLRPYIGDPNKPTTFFRHHAWDNAYVMLVEIIWHALGGR
jgi:hypothetical protein